MPSIPVTSAALLLIGFGAGLLVSRIPRALAESESSSASDLAHRRFMVSINEVRQNVVAGDRFSGHYTKTVTMSDGTTRCIELTPMVHNGMQVVELRDGGHHSYMGLNGTTTDGTLMVQIWDELTQRQLAKAEGWPF
jgi:hypothetical protein